MTDSVPITSIVDVPEGFEAIASKLEEVLGQIGLRDFDLTIQGPNVTPGSAGLVTESSEAEAAEFLEWYEGEDDEAPVPTVIAQDSMPASPSPGNTLTLQFEVAVLSDVVLELAGLEGVSLVLNPGGFTTQFAIEEAGFSVGFTLGLGIRFSAALLRPYRGVVGNDGLVTFEPDASREHTQIQVADVSITIDHTGSIDIDAGIGIQLANPVMIGDTGVIIENADIVLNLSGDGPRPFGTPPNWKGLLINDASLRIPNLFSGAIVATGLGIGSGGVSGALGVSFGLAYSGGNFSGDIVGEIFGMQGGLRDISLTLQQSIPAGGGIKAQIKLPFFDDTEDPLDLDIGFAVDGTFSATVDRPNGLMTLRKPGVLSLTVDSIGLEVEDDVFAVVLSGELVPEIGGLEWPAFRINELSIDSKGNVKLDGGWLDLREQYSLDFYGFKLEITKLGFGNTDDGGKWIGFSGGLKLVDGLQAGASVEGLRITWYEDGRDSRVSFEGIGVEFEVPEVLRFKGAVSFREIEVEQLSGDIEKVQRFDGAIKLELLALNMTIDGQLVVGTADGDSGRYSFFAIYLSADLPAGIPLWATGLGLYGVAGLFALQMEPNKGYPPNRDEEWYGIGAGEGWYKRAPIGVTDLSTKWVNRKDSLAVGAGITLGTVSDNGYTFSGKVLFAIVFPGPIILLEGKANILKERSKLDQEPIFRSLAVLDFRDDTFLVGLDAKYKYDDTGTVIDIGGSAELFTSMADANAWHLYIGEKEPRTKRIRADILKIFRAESYFMLDARRLDMGAWVGFDEDWEFGPLRVFLEAWIEGGAAVSFKPPQFHGFLSLYGSAGVSAFGISISLTADANIEADVDDPFHILGEFRVALDLPWPFDDIGADITLEWGPEPNVPAIPMPLQDVAIEHFKTTTSWPLPRGTLLLPNYDANGDGYREPATGSTEPANLAEIPVIPLDSRPHITFGRAVHDDAGVGVNPQDVLPSSNPAGWERIGDPISNEGPVRVRYGLTELALEKRIANTWARAASAPSTAADTHLYGSWALVPQLPGGEPVSGTDAPTANVKLWLWSKNPFDYTRHTGRSWDEWITDNYRDYPCVPVPPDEKLCCDFEMFDPGHEFDILFATKANSDIAFYFPTDKLKPNKVTVIELGDPIAGKTRAVCTSGIYRTSTHLGIYIAYIWLIRPSKSVRIVVQISEAFTAWAIDTDGITHGPYTANGNILEIDLANMVYVMMTSEAGFCIAEVCANFGPDPEVLQQREEMVQHLRDEMARWSDEGEVLEPHTTYRLKIVTEAMAVGEDALAGHPFPDFVQTEYAYFRTEGPPGLTELSVPIGGAIPPLFDKGEVSVMQGSSSVSGQGTDWTEDAVGALFQAQGDSEIYPIVGVAARDSLQLGRGYKGSNRTNAQYLVGKFETGLEDLTAYVHQTIPATVPAAGQKPLLPRPVYRAYDVGVEFHQDTSYVEQMYRTERRGLGLYLYDNNNQPVRDAEGRLMVPPNRWGELEDLTLTETDERWVTVVNDSDCAVLAQDVIPHSRTLSLAPDGQVLDGDAFYEARLVPLLLHEDFASYPTGTTVEGTSASLDGWGVLDEGTSGPSRWEIVEVGTPPITSKHIVQTSNIWGGTVERNDARKPGTMLLRAPNSSLDPTHADQPANWTDYRLNVFLRSADDDAIGVVFRYSDPDNCYRFSMDRERKYRRLVRIAMGATTVIAEDDFVYQQDKDYLITIEAIGSSLRVYQDREIVFDVADEALSHGGIGLYSWANEGARFTDLRVDDFRNEAPCVYRFNFTTSWFANFNHSMHSFQDEIWQAELAAAALPDAELATLVAAGVASTTPPSEAEARAYETLAGHVLGAAARQNPPEVQVTRVERNGAALAFLIQGPEPVDWKRTDLEVLHASRRAPAPALPGTVKLTDVTFGSTQPNEESVSLLLREPTNITGYHIEHCQLPCPVAEPAGDPLPFVDDFEGEASGLLFRETFGSNALDQYTIVDEGTEQGPSAWGVSGGQIVQTSNVYGGSISAAAPEKPGTFALAGSTAWANVRISATLRSVDDDAIGVVFRYQDNDNYYRLSMDRERNYRRLIKKVNGTVSVLWQDNVAYNTGQSYQLLVDAYDNQLLGYLDNALLFSVEDSNIRYGRVGFYCWANTGAHFERLSVESLEVPPILWQPAFANLGDVEIVDEASAIRGPSEWAALNGVLIQSSNIHVVDSSPYRPGTYAIGGSADWQDVQISVRMRSEDDDAIGVMFRYLDGDNYYRFSMDRQRRYRRLVKRVGGVVSVLWSDTLRYSIGQSYELTLRAVGSELRGYVDGDLLFTVYDGDLKRGRLGLYCWANTGAHFERVLVTDQTRRVGRWTIHDQGTVSAPSVWRVSGGALLQTSNIHGGAILETDPNKPGTHAIAGNLAWVDYRLTVRMRSDDDRAIGLIFRYVDEDNYYRLSVDAQIMYRRLIKKENGVVSVQWEEAGGFTVGEAFSLTVDAIGSRLVGYMGDTRLFDVTDNGQSNGQIGLYSWSNTGARFERAEVRRPPLEAYALLRDRFSAGDITGWTVVDGGTALSPSSWSIFENAFRQTSNIYTPPIDRNTLSKEGAHAIAGDPAWADVVASVRLQSFDNDAIGLSFRYTDANNYYRWSMDSERGYRRLVKNVGGSFTLLWEDDFAYEVGRPYEVTIVVVGSELRGYMDCVPMFIVEDSDLTSGQIGLYCWGNEDARFSQVRVYPVDLVFDDWLLDEPYDSLLADRWTFVDEGGRRGPSQWNVTNGELRQTSNIYGGRSRRSVPDKPGTYALAGDMAWTDYRVSVRLRSDDNDAIGVMFRYQDGDNYYRFSMDRQRRYRRLIKKVGGTIEVLWEDDVRYLRGREYSLTVECVGERLIGYLDGVRTFTVDDGDLASGRIGLYCWANIGARFAEVRVAGPTCGPYYAFEDEVRMPAGTRIQVFAGNVAHAPPHVPDVTRRFIASLDENGRLTLPTEATDLRLVAPAEAAGHARRFLPDSDYAFSSDAKVLRKADGTGFLVMPTPSPLPIGQYRLRMTYRRDNRTNDLESQVFSQAGNSGPETVTLDVPWDISN